MSSRRPLHEEAGGFRCLLTSFRPRLMIWTDVQSHACGGCGRERDHHPRSGMLYSHARHHRRTAASRTPPPSCPFQIPTAVLLTKDMGYGAGALYTPRVAGHRRRTRERSSRRTGVIHYIVSTGLRGPSEAHGHRGRRVLPAETTHFQRHYNSTIVLLLGVPAAYRWA
jgi:hypothetical protein